jgi:hypothetical protein
MQSKHIPKIACTVASAVLFVGSATEVKAQLNLDTYKPHEWTPAYKPASTDNSGGEVKYQGIENGNTPTQLKISTHPSNQKGQKTQYSPGNVASKSLHGMKQMAFTAKRAQYQSTMTIKRVATRHYRSTHIALDKGAKTGTTFFDPTQAAHHFHNGLKRKSSTTVSLNHDRQTRQPSI